jgi:LysM repeat protein
MRTSFLVSTVVAAHVVAIGSAFLIQGCGTTRGPVAMPTERPMPPSITDELPQDIPPVTDVEPAGGTTLPVVKKWTVDKTTTYVIGKGDSLSRIASRYGLTVAEIMTLNNISTPDKIQSGHKLLLPGTINLENPIIKKTSRPKATTPKLAAGSNGYTVQPGDCLSVIAGKAGVTTKALREANGIKGDNIMVGQVLAIPGGKTVSATPVVEKKEPTPAVMPTADEIEAFRPPALNLDELPISDLAPERPVPTGSATLYTVEAGDDILTVASQHNVSIADLRRVNRLSSDLLVAGQKLVIPTQD